MVKFIIYDINYSYWYKIGIYRIFFLYIDLFVFKLEGGGGIFYIIRLI